MHKYKQMWLGFWVGFFSLATLCLNALPTWTQFNAGVSLSASVNPIAIAVDTSTANTPYVWVVGSDYNIYYTNKTSGGAWTQFLVTIAADNSICIAPTSLTPTQLQAWIQATQQTNVTSFTPPTNLGLTSDQQSAWQNMLFALSENRGAPAYPQATSITVDSSKVWFVLYNSGILKQRGSLSAYGFLPYYTDRATGTQTNLIVDSNGNIAIRAIGVDATNMWTVGASWGTGSNISSLDIATRSKWTPFMPSGLTAMPSGFTVKTIAVDDTTVWMVGSDNNIYSANKTPLPTNWTLFNPQPPKPAVAVASDNINLWVIGTDNNIYYVNQLALTQATPGQQFVNALARAMALTILATKITMIGIQINTYASLTPPLSYIAFQGFKPQPAQ